MGTLALTLPPGSQFGLITNLIGIEPLFDKAKFARNANNSHPFFEKLDRYLPF